MEEIVVGKVIKYYSKINIAVIKLSDNVNTGDLLHFRGIITDFEQKIDSIELDKNKIDLAKKGQEIGIKVNEKVYENDEVLRIIE
jgi:U32 family peptidase